MQRLNRLGRHWTLTAAILAAGCARAPAPVPGAPAPPPRAVAVGSADPAFARLLAGRVAGWGAALDARAAVAPVDAADVVVVRPEELGALAAAGRLAPLPADYRAPDHPLQRARVVEVYRDALSGWGGAAVALPVAGDGFVLVSRRDLLESDAARAAGRARLGRDPSPPETYEEWAELAPLVAAAAGKPALPALPADDARLLGDFHRVAACYDRPAALARGSKGVDPATLALHYSAETLKPRLTSPGFVAAARWLADTRKLRPAGTADPVAALESGAVAAVLSLGDLTRLPREGGAVASRFTVSPLPGTRGHFDAGRLVPTAGRGNYVPYVGSGSLVAAVRATAADPAAAWAFAAELAGVGSRATLADPAVGAGPFRREDLEAARESVWLGYRFAPAETKRLAEALRAAAAVNVVNPATVLRTPDQAARMAALAKALRAIAAGEVEPEAGLARAEAQWGELDAALAPEVAARWKRQAANLP